MRTEIVTPPVAPRVRPDVGMPRDFSYNLVRLESQYVETLRCEINFDALATDHEVSDGVRERRFSRFRMTGSTLTVLPHLAFSQEDSFGHKRPAHRRFEPIVRPEDQLSDWSCLVELIARQCGLVSLTDAEVGVHAIRTVATSGRAGVPAPEGLHRDGFDYIGILACETPLCGAATTLVSIADAERVDFGPLRAGDLLVVNDREYLHYTKPFHTESVTVNRDVVIFTFQSSN
jgi:hypothetical protein